MTASKLEALCVRFRDRVEPDGMMEALAAEPFPFRKVMPDFEARMKQRGRRTIGDVPAMLRYWKLSTSEEGMLRRIVQEAYYPVKSRVHQENWRRAMEKAEAEERRRREAAETRLAQLAAQSAYEEMVNPMLSFIGMDRSGKVLGSGSLLDACKPSNAAILVRVKPKFRYAA